MTIAFSPDDIERFTQFIEFRDGPLETQCWIWTGAKSRGQGNLQWYGSFSVDGKTVRAHKFAFIAIGKGLFLPGQHLDHLCENSLCVHPLHLEAVSREINQQRKGRIHVQNAKH